MTNHASKRSICALRSGLAFCALLALAGSASAQTTILSAGASSNLSVITINGKGLQPASGPPLVLLGSFALPIATSSSVKIVADLPAGLKAGTYNLAVTGFTGTANFDVTIGAAGPSGPAGPAGPSGPQGPPGSGFSLPFTGSVSAPNATAFTITNTAGTGMVVIGAGGSGGNFLGGVSGGNGVSAVGALGGGGPDANAGGPAFSGTGGMGYLGGDGIDVTGGSSSQGVGGNGIVASAGTSGGDSSGGVGVVAYGSANGPATPPVTGGAGVVASGAAGNFGGNGVVAGGGSLVGGPCAGCYAGSGGYFVGGAGAVTSTISSPNSGGNGVNGFGGPGDYNGYNPEIGFLPAGGNGVYGEGGTLIGGCTICWSGAGGSFFGGGFYFDAAQGGGDGVDAWPGSTTGVGLFAASVCDYTQSCLLPNTNFTAGLFHGDVIVTGNMSKAGGSFQIDHPLDPANKYLYHSFVESPDMKNVYDGTVVTDGGGHATVAMPDWFEALNSDFRYQLTVIGQFSQAIVASEINHNTFTIRTDKPNVKVSWQVTGIRHDAWANAHRIPVEVEKAKADQGHYLHPELFEHAGEPSIVDLHHPRPKKRQQQ